MADVLCVVRGYRDVEAELLIGNLKQCNFEVLIQIKFLNVTNIHLSK